MSSCRQSAAEKMNGRINRIENMTFSMDIWSRQMFEGSLKKSLSAGCTQQLQDYNNSKSPNNSIIRFGMRTWEEEWK